jgi:hypothetical protein
MDLRAALERAQAIGDQFYALRRLSMRPVAIDNGQRTAGMVDVDPSISDEQIEYQARMYGLTSDAVAFDADTYGLPPPPVDRRVATLQELDNYLRTVPRV